MDKSIYTQETRKYFRDQDNNNHPYANTWFGVIASESFSDLNRGFRREDGPAVTEYYSDGTKKKEEWCRDDVLHREDGPAQIEYFRDGTVWSETWYTQGKRNRLDGPAVTEYHDNGRVNIEIWYIQNERHREDGPAYIGRSEETGQITEESWFLNDMEHRLDGPAEIYYDEDGLIDVASYYIKGEEISEVDFEAAASKSILREKSSPSKLTDKPKHKGSSL